jgi:hypothetical protein
MAYIYTTKNSPKLKRDYIVFFFFYWMTINRYNILQYIYMKKCYVVQIKKTN